MCRPTTCKVCDNTTWAGCGQHVAQVKAGVPKGQWCDGQHTDAELTASKGSSGNWFSRTFGR